MNSIVKFLIFCSFFSLYSCQKSESVNWQSIKETIREKFPKVKHISVDDLEKMIANDDSFLLIDNREESEFAVSHIKNAMSSQSGSFKLPKDKAAKIIVYCSVGYRSSSYAEKLQEQGYSNVYNLEGSIFEWANKCKPIYQNNKQVNEVHPFDKKWGQLLHEKFHPKVPK